MNMARIVQAPITDPFVSTVANTELSQRDTLEEVIVNLATVLGIGLVYKRRDKRLSTFYRPVSNDRIRCFSYQSASNTILSLSREIADKHLSDALR